MAFSPGQIVRIKCENILTYQSIEIFPCPKLNLIIGANGTGKSTIISAIILGLGGNASVVGRAKDLQQFVKVGQKHASIEIELHDPEGKGNVIIERHFSTKGDSRFFCNKKGYKPEKLERMVRRFHIQIDNLCQILPQEKLELFAKMNDHERLTGTLKTVGNHELSKNLEFLKNSKDQERDLNRKIAGLKDNLAELRNKRDAMETEVRTVKEKRFLIECWKLLTQRRAWQIYFHLKQASNLIDDSIKSKGVVIKKLIDVVKSTMAEVRESSEKFHDAKSAAEETSKKVSAAIKNVKERQNDITSSTDKVYDFKSAFKEVEMKFKSQANNMKVLREQIDKIKNEITNVSQVDRDLGELRSQLHHQERENREFEASKETIAYNVDEKRAQMNAFASKLKKLTDVNEQKMRMLQSGFEDCYKGVKWLNENKHLFKGEVYGPMFLYVNVDNTQYAKYVEASIGRRDLLAFMCEYREDTTILHKELRNIRKLNISIVTAIDRVGPERMRPPYPIQQLKHLGFHSYVNSLLSGPQIIIEYLTMTYRLHCIPIGNAQTFNKIKDVPSDLKKFFTDKLIVQVKIVERTGEKIETSTEIGAPRFLASNTNSGSVVEQFQDQYAKCEREVQRLTEEYQKLQEKVTVGDENARALIHEIKKLESKKATQKRLQRTLRAREQDLRALQNNKIDLDTEKKKCDLNVKLLLAQVTNKYIELGGAFKVLFEAFIEFQQQKINVDQFEKIHTENLSSTSNFVKDLSEEASCLRELDRKKRRLTRSIKICYTHAMKCTGRVDPRSPKFRQRKMFFKLTNDVVILDRLSRTFKAKIDCLAGQNAGLEIFQEYKALVKEVAEAERVIAKKERILQNYFAQIDDIKQKFVTEVKQLIATIDKNFRAFFEMMNCVGTVCLYEGEEGNDDFKKYGIHIKVKFRREGELHILNSQIQSGGERAVSIAIYLLSLQELTTVPFRCIDEINQGMDADNERRIFNLITQATEERGNTQYFLLTPKLLPNLNFTPHCKIFFPYNGVGSMPHKKYSQLVEKRRASQGTATPGSSSFSY